MTPLDSRQLRAFQELARHGSFTAAARSLNLTQSAISHSIKTLEGVLDAKLFERDGKTVRPTPEGEVLLPHVEAIFESMTRAHLALEALRNPGRGRLRIGATISVSQYILPVVLRELKNAFPRYEISVETADTRALLDLLERGEIDIAFGMQVGEAERFEFRPLFSDRIEMAVAADHPLATGKIDRERLAKENFLFYHRDSETFRLLEQGMAGMGMSGRMRDFLQVGSMAAIRELAKIGAGIALMAPWIAADEIAAGSLVLRPLPWLGGERHWGIYSSRLRDEENIDQAFFGHCRTAVEERKCQEEVVEIEAADCEK
jgi:DNA-binding transcriptional LysR family regulator